MPQTGCQSKTTDPQSSTSNSQLEYQGIPYSRIVDAWLAAQGIGGEVAEGGRNTTYYKLVRELRYITDFNAERLLEVLPDWGLSEAERRTTIASALPSPRGTEMPRTLASVLSDLQRTTEADTAAPEAEQDANPLPAKLPPLLSEIRRRYPRFPKAAVLASLPCLGTLLSNLRARYADGTQQAPVFFTVVEAPQASGKSFAREMADWLTLPIRENDREQRRLDNEYKEKMKAAKNAKQQPDDPHAVVRCLPATVSNAVLLKRADYAQELALFTFAEEIDTIVRGNKAGTWSQKNDIYRMAFDGAEWGQDYMADNSYSAVVHLFYNLLFLGTPLAVNNFFRKVEDGMASRFILCHLPDNRGEGLQKPVPVSRGTEEQMAALIRRAYEEAGSQPGQLVPVLLPRTLKALEVWQMERIAEFNLNPDNFALDILRRRSGVIGFRAAMIAWWLMERKETQEVVDFALWTANEVLQQQLIAFGEEMNRIERESAELLRNSKRKASRSRNAELLQSLPEVFTKADLVVARKRRGIEGECAYVITRWLKAGLIEPSPDRRSFAKR